VADILNIKKNETEKYLASFPGTWRRFEYRGDTKIGAKVYDDYAHHPLEISSTLEGFRELYPVDDGWKITVIFQPHLFSRTKLLLNDFAKCFTLADSILLLPIYFAREEDDGTISSQILSNEINKYKNNQNSESFDSFEAMEKKLEGLTFTNKDIIVTMGAGEALKLVSKILKL
jgi:UDP-N-acetylmuramate--alanine ligase